VQHHADAERGALPRLLASGEATADDVDHRLDWLNARCSP
jgi:hypothetical protein